LGICKIVDKILETNYLFALEFAEGFLFGRTIRRRMCQYKPYPVIDSSGAPVLIDPNSHMGELRFRDPRNTENEIIYLGDTTNSGYPWFIHGSIGIKPQQINMYLRFPEGKEIPGKFPNVDPIRPASGDDFGYINSLNSPYDEPTDWVEIVLPPRTRISAEYYNKDSSRKIQPVLNLTFAVYWVQFFKRDNPIIRRIVNREVPAAFLTVGFGDRAEPFSGTLAKDWDIAPIKFEEVLK
jgi:hypothetical protein